jgi:hypothetical protein
LDSYGHPRSYVALTHDASSSVASHPGRAPSFLGLEPESGLWRVEVGLAGIGMTLLMTPVMFMLVQLTPAEAGLGSGLRYMGRTLRATLGVALFGALVISIYSTDAKSGIADVTQRTAVLAAAALRSRKPRSAPASALGANERAAVLELMNTGEYAELPPAQTWARELDAGRHHCSISTMYRILSTAGEAGERRRQATHPAKAAPNSSPTPPRRCSPGTSPKWGFGERRVVPRLRDHRRLIRVGRALTATAVRGLATGAGTAAGTWIVWWNTHH